MMLLAAAVLFVVRDTRIDSPGRKPLSAARDAGCADSGLVDDKGRAEESGTTNRDTLHPHPAAPGGIDKELEPFHGRGRDSAGTGNDSPPSGRQPKAKLQAENQSSGVDAEKDKKTVGNKQGARKTSAKPSAEDVVSSPAAPGSTATDTSGGKVCFFLLDVSSSMDSVLNDEFLSALGRLAINDSCKAILFADSAVEVPPAIYKDSASLVNIYERVGEGTNIESAIFLLSDYLRRIRRSRLKIYLVSDINFAVESFSARKALMESIESVVVVLPSEHADDHETKYRLRRLRKVFGTRIEVRNLRETTDRE